MVTTFGEFLTPDDERVFPKNGDKPTEVERKTCFLSLVKLPDNFPIIMWYRPF